MSYFKPLHQELLFEVYICCLISLVLKITQKIVSSIRLNLEKIVARSFEDLQYLPFVDYPNCPDDNRNIHRKTNIRSQKNYI